MQMSLEETIRTEGPHIRPLKRVEYDRLAAEGFFGDERVELLFGVVVEMTPIDPAHTASTYHVAEILRRRLSGRAVVREGTPFAASDISEPEPDIMVAESVDWHEHSARAHLVVEVSRSSLARDKGLKRRLYGLADVKEYWIVDHVHGVVEVYRDRSDGEWRVKTVHQRGETIAMQAFPDVVIPVSEILPPIAEIPPPA